MHPENRGDLPGLPSLQRQQDRPRPVRFAAVLRFRQVTQHGLFRGIRRELRFSWHAWPPQPSSQVNNPLHRPFAGGLVSTITNSGTIIGTSGTAVSLASGDDRVVTTPGAV